MGLAGKRGVAAYFKETDIRIAYTEYFLQHFLERRCLKKACIKIFIQL